MRKLIYYVACSVDRFIAQKNGAAEGFLYEGPQADDLTLEFPETIPSHWRSQLGITSENGWFDTVLMGRKTYEIGLAEGVRSPYSILEQFVISGSMTESPDSDVTLVKTDPLDLVRDLKEQPGKHIWLCGGGELATTLYPEIDALILKVSPFLMGEGNPLFAGSVPLTQLTLADSKLYPNGFMRLHYTLNHGNAKQSVN